MARSFVRAERVTHFALAVVLGGLATWQEARLRGAIYALTATLVVISHA